MLQRLTDSGTDPNVTSSTFVSVVIPHLNDSLTLERCLQALATQREDEDRFEVIVVDNGSRSPPQEICARFDFVSMLQEPTPGPGPARSLGALAAQGEVIAFIDSDCIPQPGWLSALIVHFEADPAVEVVGGEIGIAMKDSAAPTSLEAYEAIWAYRMEFYIEHQNFTATGNMAVRKEVFTRVGPFGGLDLAEDNDWGERAVAIGVKLTYFPEAKVLTPATSSFSEMRRKWDRHISHHYAEITSTGGKFRWAARAAAIAASPLMETVTVISSPKIKGMRARILAFGCLIRIRLYRAYRMLAVLLAGLEGEAEKWRR